MKQGINKIEIQLDAFTEPFHSQTQSKQNDSKTNQALEDISPLASLVDI